MELDCHPMRWAERFGNRSTGRIQSALLSKGSILLIANFHNSQTGRVLDKHSPEQGQASVENEIADAVVFALFRSDERKSIGRVLGVGGDGLSYAHAKSSCLPFSKGRSFAPIETKWED